jgi:hypothetical protein
MLRRSFEGVASLLEQNLLLVSTTPSIFQGAARAVTCPAVNLACVMNLAIRREANSRRVGRLLDETNDQGSEQIVQ